MSKQVMARSAERIIEGTTYTLERKLPSKGVIYAKLGDEVKPETIIGEAKVSAGFRIFRLDDLLGVPSHKAKQYLRRTIGSRVYQGDIIAEVSKTFGLRSVQFISPIDGVLQHFNEKTGQLTMQFAPVTFRLPAGTRGKVTQIEPDESAFIESQVSLLFGQFTAGRMREGALKLIAPPDKPISPQLIDSRLAGYVIAGGSLVTKDVINRALAVGVRGIVTGGISAHDLLAISGEINSQEDVGLTLLITSGLGNQPIEKPTYEFLQRYQEQHVFMVPKEKMLVAPLPLTADIKVTNQEIRQEKFIPLSVGDTVRILTGPKAGQSAVVQEILEPSRFAGSRMKLAHCLLQSGDGDTIKIPVVNIEVTSSQ